MTRKASTAGQELVSRLEERYRFDTREAVLLQLAAAQADDVARLEAALERDGLVVAGSMGQLRLNMVVAELRLSRLALSKLIAELAIPDEAGGERVGRSPASRLAARASQARWDRVRRDRGEVFGGNASTSS